MNLSDKAPAGYRWIYLLRGTLFILLAVYLIARPGLAFATLGFLFGVVILLAGLVELLRALRHGDATNRLGHLLAAAAEIVVGIALISNPMASEVLLRILVGSWLLLGGISLLLHSRIHRFWMLTAGGILLILFGALILFNPVFGAATILGWIAFAWLIAGVMNLVLGLRR